MAPLRVVEHGVWLLFSLSTSVPIISYCMIRSYLYHWPLSLPPCCKQSSWGDERSWGQGCEWVQAPHWSPQPGSRWKEGVGEVLPTDTSGTPYTDTPCHNGFRTKLASPRLQSSLKQPMSELLPIYHFWAFGYCIDRIHKTGLEMPHRPRSSMRVPSVLS